MNATDCPHFDKCSAPICPLDPDWRLRTHLDGERVCFYLIEASKRGGRLPETPALPTEQRQAIVSLYPAIFSAYGVIRRRLRQTAKTGSRLGRQPGKKAEASP